MTHTTDFRILIVDDNAAIHEDFRKTLATTGTSSAALDEFEALLFDAPRSTVVPATRYELVSAMQGEQALHEVIAAKAANHPFALAFVDMRMPPGWDGLETIERIWQVDPEIQIVICSAYSDHSWDDLRTRLGTPESLLILKKPFDTIEVLQCADALTHKWALARQVRAHMDELEAAVAERTRELEESNLQLADQMRRREQTEMALRLAQRLEAVGQLAAGVAHEINTPIQYVGDNLQFLADSVTELTAVTTAIRSLAVASRTEATAELADQISRLILAADLDYLADRIPHSLTDITNGVGRIAKIVRAMKELAHPSPQEAVPVDLSSALGNALEVTTFEYRGVADVVVDLPPTPLVICHGDELNQVFINLIVNASHAMELPSGKRGTLGVSAAVDGTDIVLAISDTGCGIPPANRDRVFDAFFTTKEVGRGTGQGLAISRSIVDRHGGTLTFESTVGVGTTFFVRIPIAGNLTHLASTT